VARVVDGDTLTLAEGPTVRLLLVDAPESTGGRRECYGPEAAAALRALAEGQPVSLGYGEACADRYGRLLAYVALGERELNTLLVERGLARVLFIPPAGGARLGALVAAQATARAARRGLWGACPPGDQE
jgi:micrococcal nuclease